MKLRVPNGRGSACRCDVIAKLIEILAQERDKAAGFLKVCSSILPFRTPRYRTLHTEIILSDNHKIDTLSLTARTIFCMLYSVSRDADWIAHFTIFSALEIVWSRVRWVSAYN
jgi:hypothetical protein